ncbi:MAG: hydrogenase maturation protease [Alkaliphilus sp.]
MGLRVLGFGNLLAYDEGVGIHAIRILREGRLMPETEFIELKKPGVPLEPVVDGCDMLIIIDALAEKKRAPGTVHRLEITAVNMEEALRTTIHGFNLIPALDNLYQKCSSGKEPQVLLFGVEIQERGIFGIGLSHRVKKGLDLLLDMIWHELTNVGENGK